MRSLLGRFHRPMSRGLVNNMLTMNNLGDGSTLSLDFTTMGGVLDPRLTFSRASTATFVNSSGYVDHAGANLLLQGSNLGNASWIASALTSRNASADPNGSTQAVELSEDATTNAHCVIQLTSQNLNGLVYTSSVYMKAGTNRTVGFIRDNNVSSDALVFYTLTGSGSTTIANGSWGIVPSITSVGGGWYRCVFTIKGASTANVQFGTAKGTAYGDWSFAGTVGNSIHVWGAQVNLGSTVQTYYPTTTAAYHAPRFDYSPTNIGEPRGLLIEGNVTNFITQSQALSGYTPYSMMAISIDGTVPDPMGGAETKKIAASFSATSAFHGWVTYLASQPASTTFTVSIFAKKNNYKYLFLCDVITNLAAVRFNLDTGVADLPVGSGGLGYVSSKMTPAGASGSGWYRCEMTATTPATPATGTRGWCFQGVPDTGATYTVTGASYPGTGNSNDGIYAIGFQVEAGSGASSYIPTGASQVTRAVDTAIIAAGTNFSSWYTGGTTGTFVSNWYGSASSSTARSVIATSDVDDKHLHMYQTASALTLRLADFGALATVTTANNLNANALTKGAFSYAGTATSLCLNGGTVATNTLGFSVAPTFLSIGGPSTTGTTITDTSVMLNNSIRTIKYYPTRLTDAQIKDITT